MRIDFRGKDAIYNYHLTVPLSPLVADESRSVGEASLGGNLIVHGDNLRALKALMPHYGGKVDCVFIDPPYNTGNEHWRYNDAVNSPPMREWLGQEVVRDDLLRHEKWCCMMWPRLKLLFDLLAEDGSLWMTLDDNEVAHARVMLDEIFGSHNFVAQMVWQKSKKGDAKLIATVHEYVLVYAKDKAGLIKAGGWRVRKEGVDEVLEFYADLVDTYKKDHDAIRKEMLRFYRELPQGDPRKNHKHYNWSDDRGLYFAADFSGPDDGRESRPRYNIYHPVTEQPCKVPSTGWRWEEERTLRGLSVKPALIHFGEDENTIPCRKTYLKNVTGEPLSSVFYRDGRAGTLELERIVGAGEFDYPKNTDILARLLDIATDMTSTVLDSFAGSGTTGQAVMRLNHLDGGQRRYILVEQESYADTLTAKRLRRVIEGYDHASAINEEVWRTSVQPSKLRRLAESLESVRQQQEGRYERTEIKVDDNGDIVVYGIRGERGSVKGLGGQFAFCTLGEPLDLDRMLSGETLPSWQEVGTWLFHTAMGATLPPERLRQGGGVDEWYVSESETHHVWVLYRPDAEFLRRGEAALTLSLAKSMAERRSDKPHLVFAPYRLASNDQLRQFHVEYAPLPFSLNKLASV